MDIFSIYFHCKFVYSNNNTTKNHIVSSFVDATFIVLMQTMQKYDVNNKLVIVLLRCNLLIPFVIQLRSCYHLKTFHKCDQMQTCNEHIIHT